MNLIKKFQNKGIKGCLHFLKCRYIEVASLLMFQWYSRLPVDEHSIVLESEGDCCDNAFALFDYMKTNGYIGKYHITWLVDHPENFHNEEYVKYCYKHIYSKTSPATIKVLAQCHWYIFDHCNMMESFNKRNGQVVINLWHGCGIKATQYAKKESNIDYMITTGKFFNCEISKVFGVKINKIFPIGYPRTDYFYKEYNKNQLSQKNALQSFNKTILWMPTFRRSINDKLDESYFNSYTGLPIITSEESLLNYDKYLKEHNILCVFKIHHLQAELPAFKNSFSNIQIVDDSDIHKMGLQLYEYISLSDALITDYSSIATDYMLLNRPILYTIDDYDSYNSSRGFCFENAIDYLAGYKAVDENTFYKSLDSIIAGKDEFKTERERINNIFNDNKDKNHCERILKLMGIKIDS